MRPIVIFGSFNCDLTARATRLPGPGETVSCSPLRMLPGGKGFNQAAACHKAGGQVTFITKLGAEDAFGEICLQNMDVWGMPKHGLLFDRALPTSSALILVDGETGQNQIGVTKGACKNISKADTDMVSDLILPGSILLVQQEVNEDANRRMLTLGKEKGATVLYNPAPADPVAEDFWDKIDVIIPNETEAAILAGTEPIGAEADAENAARILCSRGPKAAVITLGKKGAYVYEKGQGMLIPAYTVTARDTTGAGDGFCGGLAAALGRGESLMDAARFGCALSALSVQAEGAAQSMPTLEEIHRFLLERGNQNEAN